MMEVNTTFFWQPPSGVDAKVVCASVPVSSTSFIRADMGVSTPVSAVLVSGNMPMPQVSA